MTDAAGLKVIGLVIMYIGFFGFLTCPILLIFKGFDEEGNVVLNKALLWLSMTLIFFVTFIVGLIKL